MVYIFIFGWVNIFVNGWGTPPAQTQVQNMFLEMKWKIGGVRFLFEVDLMNSLEYTNIFCCISRKDGHLFKDMPK